MKRFAVILMMLLPVAAMAQGNPCIEEKVYPAKLQWLHLDDCQYEIYDWDKNESILYPLMARVRLVKSGGTIRVKQVDYSDADLIVNIVDTVWTCGDWHFVESGENFTVQYVDDDSWDFRIHILTAEEVKKYKRIIIRTWIKDY
jgi:hypothetical protein